MYILTCNICTYIYIINVYPRKIHIKNDLSNQNGGICRFCSLISFTSSSRSSRFLATSSYCPITQAWSWNAIRSGWTRSTWDPAPGSRRHEVLPDPWKPAHLLRSRSWKSWKKCVPFHKRPQVLVGQCGLGQASGCHLPSRSRCLQSSSWAPSSLLKWRGPLCGSSHHFCNWSCLHSEDVHLAGTQTPRTRAQTCPCDQRSSARRSLPPQPSLPSASRKAWASAEPRLLSLDRNKHHRMLQLKETSQSWSAHEQIKQPGETVDHQKEQRLLKNHGSIEKTFQHLQHLQRFIACSIHNALKKAVLSTGLSRSPTGRHPGTWSRAFRCSSLNAKTKTANCPNKMNQNDSN